MMLVQHAQLEGLLVVAHAIQMLHYPQDHLQEYAPAIQDIIRIQMHPVALVRHSFQRIMMITIICIDTSM